MVKTLGTVFLSLTVNKVYTIMLVAAYHTTVVINANWNVFIMYEKNIREVKLYCTRRACIISIKLVHDG
jgi:uncharacterized membrane protein